MALIGLGVGPMLSGLQIAMQRTVEPRQIGAAMGTLLLLRQVGGAVALAAAETIYASGSDPATATGTGVFVLALAGAALAAAALLTLPRGTTAHRARHHACVSEKLIKGYRFVAEHDAPSRSPLYAELAAGVAEDAELIAWLDGLPDGKRQPNLLFAVLPARGRHAERVAGVPLRPQRAARRDRGA